MKHEPRWLFRFPWRTARQIARDFEEELAFHYDMRVRELTDQGVDDAEARDSARREFGDIDDARRYVRAVDGRTEATIQRRERMGSLGQELHHAWRRLRRVPLATSTAVLTLALAIGACALVVNIVWGVLLRPLPYARPDRALMIWGHVPQNTGGVPEVPMSGPYFSLIRRETRALQSVAAFRGAALNLGDRAEPVRLDGIRATGEFFDAIGVSPAIGRFFSRENEAPGNDRVVVLSDAVWRERFGARADVVGRVVTLNAEPYTIIGVAPAGFAFPRGPEMPGSFQFPERPRVWVPLVPPTTQGTFELALVARLRDEVSLDAVGQDLDRIRAIQERLFPAGRGYFGTQTVPLHTQLVGQTRPTMFSLLGAVALLLLLACVNTAQLQIAQLQARRRELAIRAAIGASSRRIVTGLMIEALTVAAMAGAIGTLLAWGGMRLVRAYGSTRLPRLADAPFDPGAVAVALAATTLAALLASLASNRVGARVPLVEALRRGGRGAGSAGAPTRARRALIVAELTLCVVLVSSAGLLVRSLSRQLGSATGFSASNGLTFEVTLPAIAYPERLATYGQHPRAVAFYGAALERIAALPQVEAVGIGKPLPLSGAEEGSVYGAEGAPAPRSPTDNPFADYIVASGGMFRALGTPLLAGRDFDARDREDAPPVVIVNQAMAERQWSGADPIGKRIKLGGFGSPARWMTVIGVTANVKRYALTRAARPEMIVPYTQNPYPSFLSMQFVVRSPAVVAQLLPALRRAIAEVDPTVPISNVRTVAELIGETTAQARFSTRFMSAFGVAALGLAMIGVYGVVAFSVSRRRQEFGVRRALGAEGRDIIGLVAREGMALAGVGLGLGLVLSVLAGHLMRQLLYEVTAFDLPTMASTIVVLAAATTVACLLPALRASRVEPRTALDEA